MFFLLSHLTGLRIHPDVEVDDDDEENEEDSDSDEEVELGEEEEEEEGEKKKENEMGKVDADDDEDPPIKRKRINTPTFPSESYDEKNDETIEKQDHGADADFAAPNAVSSGSETQASAPHCRMEFRRCQRACYTLLGDMSSSSSSSSSLRQLLASSELDVSLTVFPDDVSAEVWDSLLHGGATIYVAKDEEEEILNIAPKHNGLS